MILGVTHNRQNPTDSHMTTGGVCIGNDIPRNAKEDSYWLPQALDTSPAPSVQISQSAYYCTLKTDAIYPSETYLNNDRLHGVELREITFKQKQVLRRREGNVSRGQRLRPNWAELHNRLPRDILCPALEGSATGRACKCHREAGRSGEP
jgi:hypothetical protein